MKKSIIAGSLLTLLLAWFNVSTAETTASGKKILGHDDFDAWQRVSNHRLSDNGQWAAFSVNPQEGDGVLTFYNVKNGQKIEVERGYEARFSADSKWAYALIKPFFKETRQAKIDKKTKFDLPQDSLAIINLTNGKVEKRANVISYKTGKKGGLWVAWLSCDTAYIAQDALDDKKAGKPMVIYNPSTGAEHRINWVADFSFDEKGEKIGLRLAKCKDDSLATDGIGVVMLPDTSCRILDRDKVFYGNPVFSTDGDKLAYTASIDSTESGTRKCELFLANLTEGLSDPKNINIETTLTQGKGKHLAKPHSSDPDTQKELEDRWSKNNGAGEELAINQYSKPQFSHNGKRLIIGVAPIVAPDDTTLVDFETPSLDIWRWNSPYTPPQENILVDELRENTFPVVINLADGEQVLTTTDPLSKVVEPDRWDADWALVEDPSDNLLTLQWDYQFPVKLILKNINNGESRDIGYVGNELYELSPCGKYVAWFGDRQYHVYDIATGQTKDVSLGVPYPLWNESQDIPLPEKEPYGIMGWSENDRDFLVYDKHDVWSLDPKGEREPVCVTAGEGRLLNLRFRGVTAKPDFRFFTPGEQILYSVFNYADKKNGLATSTFNGKAEKPEIEILDGYTFYQIRQSKENNVYSWVQGNFETSPNVYVSPDLRKKKWEQASNSNPQMKDYRWGTAQLVKWYAYDGSPAEGILYLPDDFNEDETYPMIAYFYETYTEDLYYHYDMEPSWSWINFPFYVSRGYAIFVPDIHYSVGLPGESAWNYICSGVEEICKKYPNIDKNRIGIDGQSWGGYQTAYLVTRTNMFACAGSGAPVSNMTSAFGGIRWGSGDSRQAQYEMGQSRIGRNLWDAPQLYIANSPVFYADRVNTPLLIMHNDADGAVPWYQGIEMFMALRRLGKPVWMLEYNGEAHNLKERKNRKDITKRLQQFFDHYLKGDPMPAWMREGIPAIRKGQEFGY